MRKSKLYKSHCLWLIRDMHKSIEKLVDYVSHGCLEEGLNNAFMTKVTLIELTQNINKILETNKDEN